MIEVFPVAHSILNPTSLASYIARHYDIGCVAECKFLNRGLNDTFLVETTTDKFILRVYHLNWRTKSDIAYELEVLVYLANKGADVSRPIKRKDGATFDAVIAPEGSRYLALFTFAAGEALDYEDGEEEKSLLYGRSVARIHTLTDSFSSEYKRFELSRDNLIDQPLKEIQPLLSQRSEDWEYLVGFANALSAKIEALDVSNILQKGFCHGDFHGWNAHIDENKQLTFFDFDCCGQGWRVYDIATFFWGARIRDIHTKRCSAFLSGYTEVRSLSEAEIAAIPYFVAIRHIWLIGTLAANGGDLGYGWMDNKYMDYQMKLWRDLESECFRKTTHDIYLSSPTPATISNSTEPSINQIDLSSANNLDSAV